MSTALRRILVVLSLLVASCADTDDDASSVIADADAVLQFVDVSSSYVSPFAGNVVPGIDACTMVDTNALRAASGLTITSGSRAETGTAPSCRFTGGGAMLVTLEGPTERGSLSPELAASTGSPFGDVLAIADLREDLGLVEGPWDVAASTDGGSGGLVAVAVGDYLLRVSSADVGAEELRAVAAIYASALGGTPSGAAPPLAGASPTTSGSDVAAPSAGEADGGSGVQESGDTTKRDLGGGTDAAAGDDGAGPDDAAATTAAPPSSGGTQRYCVVGVRSALNVRATPNGALVTGLSAGSCNVVIDPSQAAVVQDGSTWVRIIAGSVEGWVAQRFLAPCTDGDC